MSTKILNNKERQELQPAYGLWHVYMPESAPYRFNAVHQQNAVAWKSETAQALALTLRPPFPLATSLSPEIIERVDKGDYIREKILLRTSRCSVMPMYLLIPKHGEPPFPTVLAFHGHGYGVKDIVGLWEDGEERDTPDGYHQDFAVTLCRQGFVVAAPEISCFGERQTDFSYLNTTIRQEVPPSTCFHTAMFAFHLGSSVVALRVHDAKRLVDYLETRAESDVSRLGAMGISGGGMHTFFSTCLDERIKACVISGYYCTFRDSILAMHHCACNFIPGLYQFGEMYDLVGLIAPRPMLVESGDYDPIFPREAVTKSIQRTQTVYEVFGAPENLETDYFKGRHRISGARAYTFLQEKLG